MKKRACQEIITHRLTSSLQEDKLLCRTIESLANRQLTGGRDVGFQYLALPAFFALVYLHDGSERARTCSVLKDKNPFPQKASVGAGSHSLFGAER
jgi:hypothetical protein